MNFPSGNCPTFETKELPSKCGFCIIKKTANASKMGKHVYMRLNCNTGEKRNNESPAAQNRKRISKIDTI